MLIKFWVVRIAQGYDDNQRNRYCTLGAGINPCRLHTVTLPYHEKAVLVANNGRFLRLLYHWPLVSHLLLGHVVLRASGVGDTPRGIRLLYSSLDGGWSEPFTQPDKFDLQLGERIIRKPFWSSAAKLKEKKKSRESHIDHLGHAHLDIHGLYYMERRDRGSCYLLDHSLRAAWSAATNSKCDPSELAEHVVPDRGGRSQQI